MSLSPQQPNFSQTVKSFWSRPEGTTGKIFLAAGALGAGAALFLFWGLILPFLVGVAGNTVQLALLCGLLAAITSPLWSSRVRFATQLAFQQSMRWVTSAFIQIDPIGILRTNIQQIRAQVQEFDRAVSQLSGAKQRLADDILVQQKGVMHNRDLAGSTEQQLSKLRTQLDRASAAAASGDSSVRANIQALNLNVQRLQLQRQGYAQSAGFQIQTIKTEQPLLEQADKMYEQLTRIQQLAVFKADALEEQANQLAKRRSMVQSVTSALRSGNKILKGDPQQLALIEQTVDFLNNEASDTLGALADFNRWSDKYLTDMDIQNGAAAEEAFRYFGQMEQKLGQFGQQAQGGQPGAGRQTQVQQIPPQQLAARSQGGQALDQAVAATPATPDTAPRPQEMEMPDFDSPEIQKLLK